MRHRRQDFFQNFSNASGAKDSLAQKNIVLGEIANLIQDTPKEVQALLQSKGVETSMDAKELAKKLSENVGKDQQLAIGIVKLMAKRAGNYFAANKIPIGVRAPKEEGKLGAFIKKNPELIGSVAGFMSGLFGGKKRKQAAKATTTKKAQTYYKDAIAQQKAANQQLIAMLAAKKKKGLPTIAIVGIVVGILALGGVVFFAIRNR